MMIILVNISRDHHNYYSLLLCVCLNLSHVILTRHAQQDRQNRYCQFIFCAKFNAHQIYLLYAIMLIDKKLHDQILILYSVLQRYYAKVTISHFFGAPYPPTTISLFPGMAVVWHNDRGVDI